MREKRYSKDMKGTQGKEEERYPLLEGIREISEREGGIEERGGKGDNKGSFCRSWSRNEGIEKRRL